MRKCISVKISKRYVGPAIGAAGLAFLLLTAGINKKAAAQDNSSTVKEAFKQYIGSELTEEIWEDFMPVYSFAKGSGQGLWQRMLYCRLEEVVPLLCMEAEYGETKAGESKKMTMEMILMAEGQEDKEKDLQQKEEQDALFDALLQAENQAAREKYNEQVDKEQDAQVAANAFVPHTEKLAQVDMASLGEYETLLKTFYTVDKSTVAGSELLDVEKLSSRDMTVSKDAKGPQILIYHTHSQEAFADSLPGDKNTSIVGVGEHLSRILTETYGYQVLHHEGVYDLPARDDAYSVALPEIEKILEENPQIQVVIDLHRDAMDENTRLVTQVDGRPTAKFMFFNGLSRTRKTGKISYLYNENLEDNLAFSFQMQVKAMEYYPGLTRKVYLKAYRYNMHLRPRNLLIELGAQNNTVEEAMNACEPLAHILDMVLSGQE